jgi:hypothetical protein
MTRAFFTPAKIEGLLDRCINLISDLVECVAVHRRVLGFKTRAPSTEYKDNSEWRPNEGMSSRLIVHSMLRSRIMISKPNRPSLLSQFPRKDQIANPSVLDMKRK